MPSCYSLCFIPGSTQDTVDEGLGSNHAIGGEGKGGHDGEEAKVPGFDQDDDQRDVAAPGFDIVVNLLPQGDM